MNKIVFSIDRKRGGFCLWQRKNYWISWEYGRIWAGISICWKDLSWSGRIRIICNAWRSGCIRTLATRISQDGPAWSGQSVLRWSAAGTEATGIFWIRWWGIICGIARQSVSSVQFRGCSCADRNRRTRSRGNSGKEENDSCFCQSRIKDGPTDIIYQPGCFTMSALLHGTGYFSE